jgi:hypothetical protein
MIGNGGVVARCGLGLCLLASSAFAQQTPAPTLSTAQRSLLRAVVAAVDEAARLPDTPDAEWSRHVLRASDGSHYVAFSVVAPAGTDPNNPVMLYVRLATRHDPRLALAPERSAIAEWLAGRTAGLPPRPAGIAVGQMPTFGAGSGAARGVTASQDLQLVQLERERARQRREDEERDRKVALEGKGLARAANAPLPFEDFDLQAQTTRDARGVPVLRRSLTAGPGSYDLIVGWTDATARNAAPVVQIAKHRLDLLPASPTGLALSSVIVAEHVGVREAAVPASRQTAHPYSIGMTEIVPARDHTRTNDDQLALFFQVINPRPAAGGKPDIHVGFRLTRQTAEGVEPVGALSPQVYNDTTLPPDFDVTKGHPIFVAVGIPLRSFKRGAYRVEVVAEDRLTGTHATTDVAFTVVGTPGALLREAPPLRLPFRREALLEPRVLEALVAGLRPARPSSALEQALAAAAGGRFVELVRHDTVAGEEQGTRSALRALALYALGDTAPSTAAALRQALQSSASPAAVHVLLGASRALAGNDREAIGAWQVARDEGFDAEVMAVLLIDAHMRLGEAARATEVAGAASSGGPPAPALARRVAMIHLASQREAEAVAALEPLLQEHPDDVDAQWLMLQALFTGLVRGTGPASDAAGRARFGALALRYIASGAPHAALAAEWRRVVEDRVVEDH